MPGSCPFNDMGIFKGCRTDFSSFMSLEPMEGSSTSGWIADGTAKFPCCCLGYGIWERHVRWIRLDHLLDFTNTKSGVEAVMVFPTPAPLIAAAQIMYAIAAESPGYKLTKENCWFFASTIQEMLMRMFGAKYEKGLLNHPTIGPSRREPIKVLTYPHIAKEINDTSETILRFARLLPDSKLAKAVKFVLDAVKNHHAFAYQGFSPSNASQAPPSTRELLAALQQALHEHVHGCNGIQGARMFSTSFTDTLIQILPSLEQLQEDNFSTPISGIIRLLESSVCGSRWSRGLSNPSTSCRKLFRCIVVPQLPIIRSKVTWIHFSGSLRGKTRCSSHWSCLGDVRCWISCQRYGVSN
ncbi:uncharacterized protein EI90DRAFT_1220647 [Cantharellus anzutake]|uniref:uncharacterized protein n=1 Tax=Cantharellus anzutake TaxID=1750568 RepID=UPI00190401CE|nr:uncharacterized protein EI90DRAFT_1220647 [Cantharellus anzutake]KAF8310431.1 hypothetical protein EI90DRAFT_1220647 [Cantharellus anzutake]